MIVKVGRVGGKVQEVALPGDATVADALKAAGITKTAQDSIYLNGTQRTDGITTYRAANSDLIIVEEKRIPFTPAMRGFCEVLIDQMRDEFDNDLDIEDYYDEDIDGYDYEEFFSDHKSMILGLITAAKEAA